MTSSFAESRLERLKKLQELRAQRDKLVAQDPGGARQTLLAEYPTPLDFAARFDMRTRRTPALELLSNRFAQAVKSDNGRLVVSIPPQEGKTTLIRWLITWLLVDNPDRRIVFASFAQSLARQTGREVRNKLQTYSELALPLDQSHRDATDWGIAGKDGGLYSVGVGGALTGRPADCVAGDTLIPTENGLRSARDIHESPSEYVLSLNHVTGEREFKPVVATRRIERRPVVDVVTSSGRTLRCTADHLVHTPNGYRAAGVLRPGDEVTVTDLPGLRRADRQQEGSDLSAVLPGSSCQHVPAGAVHAVRGRVPADARGAREEAPQGADQSVLLAGVRGSLAVGARQGALMPTVRGADRAGQRPEVLHASMSTRGAAPPSDKGLPGVRRGVHSAEQPHDVLLEDVLEPSSLVTDDGSGQLALHRRDQLCRVVPQDAPTDHRAGRAGVPRVPDAPRAESLRPQRTADVTDADAGAPHRPRSTQQRAGELDPAVLAVSRGASQVGTDTVSVVRAVRGAGEPVYDLQVEGNRNFFAGEVLVHNCMIVDDPLRGMADADSDITRDNLHEWWESVARTRLAPGAPALVIQTRWHEDDLAGRLIGQGWPSLNIPALADGQTEDALDREPGEWLVSARGRTPDDWAAIRNDVGERTFAALYQGRPAPLEGGIFKREWFNTHRLTHRPEFNELEVGVDPADTGKGDAAGILVAGVTASNQIVFVADESGQLSQAQWARRACLAWIRHGANRIVQEHNLGMRTSIPDAWALLYRQATALGAATGEDKDRVDQAHAALIEAGDLEAAKHKYIAELLPVYQAILEAGPSGPRVVSITPRQSKRVRAESVAGAFETGRAAVLGELKALEHECCTWQENQKSPNRIDTLAMLTMHLESVRGSARVHRASPGDGGAVIPINTAKGRSSSRGVTPIGMRRAMRGVPQSPHENGA